MHVCAHVCVRERGGCLKDVSGHPKFPGASGGFALIPEDASDSKEAHCSFLFSAIV